MSHFKLEEVLAHKQLQRLGCGEKTKTPEIQPYILSPLDSLQAFQKNMQGSELLGTLYWNPYGSKGGNCEYIPKNASELTIRHQQMLSRFEGVNTRGIINLTQCGAAIPREKIAINRGTVKHTPVIGIGKATHNGGYNSPREPGSQEKCYTIDQAGEQFQEFHNTGARFFYPQKDSLDLLDGETYLQFQEDLYEAMEGKKRPPETEITNSFPVIWTSKSTGISIPGIIDLDGLEKSYAREFKDALELANCTILIEEPGKKANFRFFMAGMGAFSGGIAENKSHPTAPGACCLARLQAINKVVAQFLQIFLQTGENKLKGIGTLGLPYSRNIAQQYESEAYALLESIQKNLVQMNIKWSGAHEFSGKTLPNEILVETNAGDLHAFAGNEGWMRDCPNSVFQSVDPMQFFNRHMEHHNIAWNTKIRVVHALTSEAFKAAQPLPEPESLPWAVQYQWAVQTSDIRTLALFFRKEMQQDQINPSDLKKYMAACLENLKTEISNQSDYEENAGLLYLCASLNQFSEKLDKEDNTEALVDLIKDIYFVNAILEQEVLPRYLESFANYEKLKMVLKEKLQIYIDLLETQYSEEKLENFCKEILEPAFLGNFNAKRKKLTDKIARLPLPEGVASINPEMLMSIEPHEENYKILMELSACFTNVEELTNTYLKIDRNLMNSDFDLAKACGEFGQLFSTMYYDLDSVYGKKRMPYTDQALKDLVLDTCRELKKALIDNCREQIQKDFKEPQFQPFFSQIPEASKFLAKINGLDSIIVCSYIILANRLINEKLPAGDLLNAMFYGVVYNDSHDIQEDMPVNDQNAHSFIMEQWTVYKILEILNIYVQKNQGLRKEFFETLRQIIQQNCVKKDRLLGYELYKFNRYLLDAQFYMNTATTNYRFALGGAFIYTADTRVQKIASQINDALARLENNDEDLIMAEQAKWIRILDGHKSAFAASKNSLIFCRQFVDANLPTCIAYTKALGEVYFAQERLANCSKILPGLEADCEAVSACFNPVSAFLEMASLDLFRANKEEYARIMESAITEIMNLGKKVGSFKDAISSQRSIIYQVVDKIFDKKAVEQDLKYLARLQLGYKVYDVKREEICKLQSRLNQREVEINRGRDEITRINEKIRKLEDRTKHVQSLAEKDEGNSDNSVSYVWNGTKYNINNFRTELENCQNELESLKKTQQSLPTLEQFDASAAQSKAALNNEILRIDVRRNSCIREFDALNKEFNFAKSLIKKGQSLFSEQDPELAWDDVKISFTSAYKRRLKEQLKSIQQSCIPFSNRLFSQFVLQNYDSDIPLFSCNLAFMAEVSPKGVHAIAQTRIFLTDVLIAKILVKIKKLEPAAQSHLYALMHAIKTLHQEAGRCFDFGTYKLLHMMEAFIQYDKFNITSFKKAVLNYKALATLLYDPALEDNWGNLVAKARDLDALLLQSEIRADFVKSPADQDFDNLFLQLPAEAPQESLLLSERPSDLKTENLMQGREANGFFKAKDPDSESFHSTRPESAGHQTG